MILAHRRDRNKERHVKLERSEASNILHMKRDTISLREGHREHELTKYDLARLRAGGKIAIICLY